MGPDRPPPLPARPVPPRLQRVERWARAHPTRVDLLVAAALGLPLLALSAVAMLDQHPGVPWTVVQLGAAAWPSSACATGCRR